MISHPKRILKSSHSIDKAFKRSFINTRSLKASMVLFEFLQCTYSLSSQLKRARAGTTVWGLDFSSLSTVASFSFNTFSHRESVELKRLLATSRLSKIEQEEPKKCIVGFVLE
jgi:hypothetical protein